MTEYTDVEEVNKLVAEQNQLQLAIDILNDNGTVSSVVASPTDESDSPDVISIGVLTPDAPQKMIEAVKSGLAERYNAINKELSDLGVSGAPPDVVIDDDGKIKSA
jgi:hypothetical protein